MKTSAGNLPDQPMDAVRLVSGGQSGVDRAALDVALARGLPYGGWCPRGRWAEDGTIPARYPLMEADSDDPAVRTGLNVHDADATLIIMSGSWDEGTRLTAALAREAGRPLLVVDLTEETQEDSSTGRVRAWIAANGIRTLNIAGPRESRSPGIEERARRFLETVFSDHRR